MGTRSSPIPSSPAAFWEPNPEWSLDGPRYLVTLHLPVNCASDDIAVAQFRRISHDEIRVSILNDRKCFPECIIDCVTSLAF